MSGLYWYRLEGSPVIVLFRHGSIDSIRLQLVIDEHSCFCAGSVLGVIGLVGVGQVKGEV
jgi:hypothetical protein